MKNRLLALALAALCLLLPFSLAACNDGGDAASSSEMKTVCDQNQYILYGNVFSAGHNAASLMLGKSFSVSGIYASIEDTYHQTVRYYVWGFADQTKCCDWQWEFVPKAGEKLPAPGSYVTLNGTFSADAASLDGYWVTDASLTVKQAYTGETEELDMSLLNATLSRVQLYQLQAFGALYAGRTVRIYGRVCSASSLQHPYYDGVWELPLTGATLPATGTPVTVTGTYVWDAATGTGSLAVTSVK